MFKTLIVPIASLMLWPAMTRADGYASYKDEPAATYSRAYSAQPMRKRISVVGAWSCPPQLLRAECRRILAEVEQRRARQVRRSQAVLHSPTRYAAPAPVNTRGRCLSRVTVTGVSRPTEGLARGNAWKRWRETVRAGAGEAYMDDRYAVNQDVRCHIASSGGWTKRCTVSATPCK